MDRLAQLLVLPLRALVLLYRGLISPLLGPRCRFHPSCSVYAEQALAMHGLRALPWIAKRLLRCHPWNPGGLDPVPPEIPGGRRGR